MLKREDAGAALEAAGMRRDDPPEEWLVKAWDGDVMSVLSMEMRVMAIEDVLTTKLMAVTERHLRYEDLIAIARALREQIDWAQVRAATASSPFARAFFVLVEGLGIVPPVHEAPEAGARPEPRVRELTDGGSEAAAAG